MPLSPHDNELIQSFIDNDLSDDQRAAFDVRMSDQDFSNELKLRVNLVLWLQQHEEDLLKRELKVTLGNITLENNRSLKTWYYAAAATVTVLIASLLWYFNKPSSQTPSSLFLSYYEPYKFPQVRGNDDTYSEIAQLYNTQQYAEAANLIFKQFPLISDQSEQNQFRILLANCLLNSGQVSEAIQLLKEVSVTEDTILRQHARWYLALALIKQEQLVDAEKTLNNIIEDRSIFHEQAVELKKSINQILLK